ncbi:MAG: hypoxanthine phosphoribosyltransferase [Actinomycetota bacterium]|nr:hypoxanthine phosphoribosyltransferase [Actinomycetota bacterium]
MSRAVARTRRVGAPELWLDREAIAARVRELGAEIGRDYAGRDLLLVVVLRGGFVFASDLSRAITAPHALDFVALAGYAPSGQGGVRLMKDLDAPIESRSVLLVENIVDTGLTLNHLVKSLVLRRPADLAICALLDRPRRRLCDDLPLRYVGFEAPEELVVGYGFDLDGRYRGLPDLHLLRGT